MAQFNINTGLIVYYPFNYNANDSSGNGHHAMVHGPVSIPGISGGAYHFDGVDDFIEKSYHSDFTVGDQNWTVSVWIRIGYNYQPLMESSNVRRAKIVDWYRCGVTDCRFYDYARYTIEITPEARISYKIRDDETKKDLHAISTSAYDDGIWHLATGVYDSQKDSLYLYMDGKLVSQIHANRGSLTDGGNPVPLEIGRHYVSGWNVPDQYFEGDMDELRIYNRALSFGEISNLYKMFTTSISDPISGLDILIYPNPTKSELNIQTNREENILVRIYNLQGKMIKELENPGQINIGDLAPSLYILEIESGNELYTSRIIKL